MEIKIKPIALVKNSRKEPTDDNWGDIISEITLVNELTEEAFRGIEDFSHLEIIFHFHVLTNSCIIPSFHFLDIQSYHDGGN